MTDNCFIGQYDPRIKRSDFEKINKIFSQIDNSLTKPEFDLVIRELDRFRNMLFLEGILQDHQCFISLAYDLDRFITEQDFNALEEIKMRFDGVVKSKDLECGAFHIKPDYGILEKLKWFNHFIKATKNFKDLNGWNTPKEPKN